MTWIIFWIGNGTANLQFFMQELLLNLNNIINFAVLIWNDITSFWSSYTDIITYFDEIIDLEVLWFSLMHNWLAWFLGML
jgi:hypothetical protein